MSKFLEFLEKQKYPVILLISGMFLIFCGFFEIKDLTKCQIHPHADPYYFIVSIGLLFSLSSVFLYLFDVVTLGWIGFRRIRNLSNGITAKLSNTNINIRFGRLEKLSGDSEESLVVLPANEFFDDECINDKKSALGAYVNYKFTNQTESIESLISSGLDGHDFEEVEKETGVIQKSYGIGNSVFIKEPLSSKQPVLFLSVTTKRTGEGLQAEMSYIFKAVKEIKRIVVDQRINSVYVPVMGSGHGGLRNEVAFFGMLLAVCDVVTKPHGHHINEFNIIVFQSSEKDKPSISKAVSKRLLRIATGMYS